MNLSRAYRGRIAPSPTGLLHLGHARTFWIAHCRAVDNEGTLILRNEDIDVARCRPEYVSTFVQDLAWLGIKWQEGPDCGGNFGPYSQSERMEKYRQALITLAGKGLLFPCRCSRKDIRSALSAPHAADEEPVYPGHCRCERRVYAPEDIDLSRNWRFQVPDRRAICFHDAMAGEQTFEAGQDFGDFLVWRQDGMPSYQLAVTVDDHEMEITEVVRGADLLVSTARQLLLYEAFGWSPPIFCHCPLMTDEDGKRLAKRHDALSLKVMRESGQTPEQIVREFEKSFQL